MGEGMDRLEELLLARDKIAKLEADNAEHLRINKYLAANNNTQANKIAELSKMLWISWEAICESGYEGYSLKLREFMENLDEPI